MEASLGNELYVRNQLSLSAPLIIEDKRPLVGAIFGNENLSP